MGGEELRARSLSMKGTVTVMGTHAKPRTTGRKAALGALAVGASLTGVGLIAAALDPSTAVLTADGAAGDGATQLSGLSSPVSLDLSPAAASVTDLTPAPLQQAVNPAAATGAAHRGSAAVDWFTKPAIYTKAPAAPAAPAGSAGGAPGGTSGTPTAVKPIGDPNPAKSGGSGSTGSSGSGSTGSDPSGSAGSSSAIQDAESAVSSDTAQLLPAVRHLVGQVPVVSSLVSDSAAGGTVSSLPLVGTLLSGGGSSSGDGASAGTAPGLSAVTGLL
jgi:hypothetical protein